MPPSPQCKFESVRVSYEEVEIYVCVCRGINVPLFRCDSYFLCAVQEIIALLRPSESICWRVCSYAEQCVESIQEFKRVSNFSWFVSFVLHCNICKPVVVTSNAALSTLKTITTTGGWFERNSNKMNFVRERLIWTCQAHIKSNWNIQRLQNRPMATSLVHAPSFRCLRMISIYVPCTISQSMHNKCSVNVLN